MKWFEFLKNYEGAVRVNGKVCRPEEIDKIEDMDGDVEIELTPKSLMEPQKYKIFVKGWMSNNSGNLDFHRRWNGGIPMPSTTMSGTILAETPGMYKMDLTTEDGKNRWLGYVSKAAIISMEEL